jgi:hypothetical protein
VRTLQASVSIRYGQLASFYLTQDFCVVCVSWVKWN